MGRPSLPVDDAIPRVIDALAADPIAVLQAPPGTGKTTRVPPALLGASWLEKQRVIVLEPRRVAARAAATRIAGQMGERVGETVGLRTRFDSRTGPTTRLEVVTEGVLTQMLIRDPGLSGVGCVVFDEFHERSIHADTAMAFCRETAAVLRDDLRILAMSATFDAGELGRRLGTGSVLRVDAPAHPVETIYRAPAPGRAPEDEVPDAVIDALGQYRGDILVFLAGARDIRQAHRQLADRVPRDVTLTPLHGALPGAEQDRALSPDVEGRRKVILSTPIAETSVTIDGVGVVIDTGRRRRPELDLGRGMSQLRTVSASQAATDQRRGRAGRQGPGHCIRLWPEIDQGRRQADEPPEILTADLTALALQIAAWGAADAAEIPWLDPPPEGALAAGRGVLTALGALDDTRHLTQHGRRMAEMGTEPRLAHLLLSGAEEGIAATACDLAGLLSDRDILTGSERPSDLRLRIDALHADGTVPCDPSRRRRARELAQRWRRDLDVVDDRPDTERIGWLVATAYPERIAQRRREVGSFLLSSGAGVSLPPSDPLAREEYLAVAETDGLGGNARIVTAAPLSPDDLESLFSDHIETVTRGGWDRRARDVVFEHQRRLGALVLHRESVGDPDPAEVTRALLAGVRREGLGLLGWSDAARRLRDRLQFLHRVDPETWPRSDDESLLETLDDWLGPNLGRARRRADLERVDVRAALLSQLDWRQTRDLDRLAPTHFDVPSGSRLPIDYRAESGPVLAVRLQEMFGLTSTPTVAGGAVPLVIHLLSPAHRPVQVTTDLESFWQEGYAQVRRELRGRYPKHHWPEDPTTATPTNRAKPRA